MVGYLKTCTCCTYARGVGEQAVGLIVEEARRVADGLDPTSRLRIQTLSSAIQQELGQLVDVLQLFFGTKFHYWFTHKDACAYERHKHTHTCINNSHKHQTNPRLSQYTTILFIIQGNCKLIVGGVMLTRRPAFSSPGPLTETLAAQWTVSRPHLSTGSSRTSSTHRHRSERQRQLLHTRLISNSQILLFCASVSLCVCVCVFVCVCLSLSIYLSIYLSISLSLSLSLSLSFSLSPWVCAGFVVCIITYSPGIKRQSDRQPF